MEPDTRVTGDAPSSDDDTTDEAVPSDADRALRNYLLGQLLALAALIGAGLALAGRSAVVGGGIAREQSGRIAALTNEFLPVATVAAFAIAVAGPLAFALLRGEVSRRLVAVVGLAVAVVAGAATGALVAVFGVVSLLAAPVALGVLVLVAVLNRWRPPPRNRLETGRTVSAGGLLACAVLVAIGGGALGVAAVPVQMVVSVDPYFDTPTASFEMDYDPSESGDVGRLDITHQVGPGIDRDRLLIVGTGFANVSGVDQTGPGPWRGEATGPPVDRTGSAGDTVRPGDQVSVGVTGDCSIQVRYGGYRGVVNATLAEGSCADDA